MQRIPSNFVHKRPREAETKHAQEHQTTQVSPLESDILLIVTNVLFTDLKTPKPPRQKLTGDWLILSECTVPKAETDGNK